MPASVPAYRAARRAFAAGAALALSQALLRSRRGSTMIQYCVLASVVSLALYGSFQAIGDTKTVRLTDISNAFKGR